MSNNPGPNGPTGPTGPDPQGRSDGFGQPSGPSYGSGPGSTGGPGQAPQGSYGGGPQNPYGGPPQGGYPTGPQSANPAGQGMPQGGYPSYPTGPQSANPQGPGGPQAPYSGGQPNAGYPQGFQQPGPYPGQPGPGGYPQGPGPNQGGPAKKSKVGLFVIIGVGALVLILILVIGGIVLFGKKSTTAGGGGGGGGQTSAPAPKKPSDAVQAYLQALASGKAADALALSSDQPPSTTFLTDAVLQASIKKAPITAISVPETTGSSTYSVDATYKIGSQTVTDTIEVEQAGDDWKVKQAWAQASLYNDSDLPLYLNGVQAKEDKVYLFPGVYTASTGNAYIGWGSNPTVLVKSPSSYPSFSSLDPTLTSAGKSAFVQTVKSALSSCVKSHSLKPGCGLGGFHASKGVKVTNVRHSIASGSVDHASVDISASDPYEARSYPTVRIKTTARCDGGGCTGLYDQYIGSVTVDLSKKPLRANWS